MRPKTLRIIGCGSIIACFNIGSKTIYIMEYRLSEIAEICGGALCGADVVVRSVTADSRRSVGREEAPLFVAIRGRNHDGHDYIADLYRRGVRGFMVEREVDADNYPEAGFVKVGKSLYGLQALAANYRASFSGVVVGITGSSGKTTVKEWIAQAAPEGVAMFRSPRSYNSQLGVPLSILMMAGNEDYALIEAGISRPGEMERLAEVIRPDLGVFTGLGPEHGENFQSDKQKMREKAQLFATCKRVIYFGDEPVVEEALRLKAPEAELIDAAPYAYMLSDEDAADSVTLRNKALVAAFYDAVGTDGSRMGSRLQELRPVTVRLGMREGIAGSLLVTDMNNTDMNSLPMALDYLNSVAGGRETMLIMSDIPFGSMPDWELYGQVGAMVRTAGIDRFIGVGERISACRDAFDAGSRFFSSAEEFIGRIMQDEVAGKAILLRGNADTGFIRILHHLDRRSHTTVLEVDLDAMRHNLDHYRTLVGEGVKLMAMVKASGYGNGNFEVADMLDRQGVNYLAVAFADEGVRLREKGIAMPIVVLNADEDSFALMVANRLEPEIYNFRSLRHFVAAVRDAGETAWPVHIKIDTGMHRLGFRLEDMAELTAILRRESGAVVARSVFSHLAAADMPQEDDFTRGQIDYFRAAVEALSEGIGYCPLRHILNTAGMERFPEARFDMCRLGIGLYGVGATEGTSLHPVSRLATRIVQVKELDDSETVGYGRSGRLSRRTRVATIPIGYADGLDRRLGNGLWSVLVGGAPAPIVGRICMDSCMVDITGLTACEGDEVIIFGSTPGNTVSDMAAVLDTIPYEIMTSVSERVKRIYLKE